MPSVAARSHSIARTDRKNVFESPEKQSCKVSMMKIDKGVLYVLLEGVRSSEVPESGQSCLMALIDLTGYGKPEDSMNKSI